MITFYSANHDRFYSEARIPPPPPPHLARLPPDCPCLQAMSSFEARSVSQAVLRAEMRKTSERERCFPGRTTRLDSAEQEDLRTKAEVCYFGWLIAKARRAATRTRRTWMQAKPAVLAEMAMLEQIA